MPASRKGIRGNGRPTKRELSKLTSKQLAQTLEALSEVLWARFGVEPWPEDGDQPEALETLTSACDEIHDLMSG